MAQATTLSFDFAEGHRLNTAQLLFDMSLSQRLLWEKYKMQPEQEIALAKSLLVRRVQVYEAQISSLARKYGCRRNGRLTNALIRDRLETLSQQGAESIVNTFNTQLAATIIRLGRVSNTQILSWIDQKREFKSSQVSEWLEGTTIADVNVEFFDRNRDILPKGGVAVLQPRTAKEIICQGWINRGAVPVEEAVLHPPPYHLNCPHVWNFTVKKFRLFQRPFICRKLWLGK